MRLGLLLLMVVALSGCSDTPHRFCHGIYDHGGTPKWAKGQFHDFDSCVAWSRDRNVNRP